MVIKDFGMPFNDVASDRLYSAADWSEYFGNLVGNGVVGETGNELAVIQQTVPNKSIIVSTGAVIINGAMRVVDVAFNLTLADNTSGNPRIDRIVARLNTTDRKLEIVVKQGTPAASPSAPALTQNSTTWEISLAKINLANGFSSVVTANIIDERTYMTYKDRVLNDRMDAFEITIDSRMDALEVDITEVNARMDTIDPAKYYGKYSQMSGGDGKTGTSGLIAFTTEDNDDFTAINLGTSNTKITIPAGATKAKFFWKGTIHSNEVFGIDIALRKNGSDSQTLIALNDNYSTQVYLTTLVYSTVVNCVAGDYFELYANVSGGSYPASLSAGSIFGMEILK